MKRTSISAQITNLLVLQNQLSVNITRDYIEKHMHEYVYIIDDDHVVIACARIRKMSYYLAEIAHMSVNQKYQGQQFGSKILKLAEEFALKIPNVKILQSTIRKNNIVSINMFFKSNWSQVNQFVNTVTGNDIVVMMK